MTLSYLVLASVRGTSHWHQFSWWLVLDGTAAGGGSLISRGHHPFLLLSLFVSVTPFPASSHLSCKLAPPTHACIYLSDS